MRQTNRRPVALIAGAVFVMACILTAASGGFTYEAVAEDGTLTPWAYLPYVSRGQPPMPAPTPIPQGVYVLSHSYQRGYILGEVLNNTNDNISSVKVVANFFDDDDRLVEIGSAYIHLSPLPAGEKSCFGINASGDWAYYQFEPPSYWTSSSEPRNLTIVNHRGEYIPESEYYRILGFLRNDCDFSVSYAGIVSTLYDALGTVISCGYTHTSSNPLSPGQVSSFEIWHYVVPAPASYRLQTD